LFSSLFSLGAGISSLIGDFFMDFLLSSYEITLCRVYFKVSLFMDYLIRVLSDDLLND